MSDAMKNDADISTAKEETKVEAAPSEATFKDVATTVIEASGTEEPEKKNNKTPIIILIVVLAVVIIGVGAWFAFGQGDNFYDNSAQSGQAPYKTDEEKQAELDRVVEEGMLNISIASVIEFQDGTSEGTAYIENVPSNKYDMKVTITLDSNGDVVYESGGIKPDTNIPEIKLMKDLEAGTYPATATFAAYYPDTHEEVGQAAAKITIVVNE